MPNTTVVDLSHHNTIGQSLVPAKQAGVLGLIHKCTEGTSYTDSKCSARYWLANDAAMLWGIYHFLRPGSMQEQANYFLTQADWLGVLDGNTLLACDYEDPDVSLADVQSFMEAVYLQAQRSPVLYSGHVLKDKPANPALNQYRLWLAQYTTGKPTLPTGWSHYWLWQWTDQAVVAGINPPTDANDYQGTEEAIRAEWSGRKVQPQPEPEPPPEGDTVTELKLTIRSKGPVTVTLEPMA